MKTHRTPSDASGRRRARTASGVVAHFLQLFLIHRRIRALLENFQALLAAFQAGNFPAATPAFADEPPKATTPPSTSTRASDHRRAASKHPTCPQSPEPSPAQPAPSANALPWLDGPPHPASTNAPHQHDETKRSQNPSSPSFSPSLRLHVNPAFLTPRGSKAPIRALANPRPFHYVIKTN